MPWGITVVNSSRSGLGKRKVEATAVLGPVGHKKISEIGKFDPIFGQNMRKLRLIFCGLGLVT